jgi:hypothetical protein
MTNPTTNFGWQMPTPTDLVTDLPADFEVFGQAVDTDFVDLLGGTTGQILSKTSNTDLDFTWITNDVGDITAVNVTAPITGGGTSGAVTIGINAATTSVVGAVQLSDSTSTTSSVLAATPTAVKAAYDLAAAAQPAALTINTQTGTTYTLISSDATKLVTLSNAAAITLTLPPSIFTTGQQINLAQLGAGQVTFAAGVGVTIVSTGATAAAPKISKQYGAATAICTASNTFLVVGSLA